MTYRKPKSQPTMNDVARLAGVSQTTVSFVINNSPNASIPDETRAKVWAAVEQLGYRPNALAQSLRSQRSGILGFVTDEIAITPYAGRIFEGAQDIAWEHGKILLLVNTKRNPDLENFAVEMLLERQVEGIIYATMYHRPVRIPDTIREVPVVLLDCFVPDRTLPSVVPDEVTGGRQATEFLLTKGHRRIGFLNDIDTVPAAHGRLAGYKIALSAYDVVFDETLVTNGESSQAGGYRSAMQIMQRPDPPTAIFCYNDRMAMGAYDALRKLDLRIPEDVAVVGFDNQEIIAAHLYPPLTTMELPHYRMGTWAVNHLLELSVNPDVSTPVQRKEYCTLIERESA